MSATKELCTRREGLRVHKREITNHRCVNRIGLISLGRGKAKRQKSRSRIWCSGRALITAMTLGALPSGPGLRPRGGFRERVQQNKNERPAICTWWSFCAQRQRIITYHESECWSSRCENMPNSWCSRPVKLVDGSPRGCKDWTSNGQAPIPPKKTGQTKQNVQMFTKTIEAIW
jgi:hypothetical protein